MEQLPSHTYMTNDLLIYGEIFAHFLIIRNLGYDFATDPLWISLYMYEEKCIFFFISVSWTAPPLVVLI
jgi:hypothetical protein